MAGFGLRLYDLGKQPLWFDETYNLALVQNLSFFDALTFYRPWLIHPPLFLAAMNLWMHYFGQAEFTLRFFSALMGTAVLPVVYIIARRWINRRVALTGLVLLAVSSLQLYTSQTIRPYPWLTLQVALSMGLAFFAVERPEQNWRWLLYALSAAAMIYVHYLGFHAIFVQVVFFGLALYQNRRALVKAALSLVLVGLLFLPWLGHFLEQSKYYGDSLDYLANGGLPKLLTSLQYLASWFAAGSLVFLVGAVFLPLYVLGLIWLWQTRRNLAILLAGWSLGPFVTCWLSSFITPNFSQQRLSFCVPGFLIVVAAGIWSLAERGLKMNWSYLALILTVALSLSACFNYYQNYRNQDWPGLVNYIVANRQPGDLIFLTNKEGTTLASFNYYYDYKLAKPGNLDVRYVVNNNQVAQEVTSLLQGRSRAWLVDWDINGDWFHRGVLPNIPPEYKQVSYMEFPSSEQGSITLRLIAKNP